MILSMKKAAIFSFFLASLFLVTSACAQEPTVAKDFTLTDCHGIEHNLFSELDAGNVVVMSLMMDCPSCVNFRKKMPRLQQIFGESHPGRLHMYSMARTDDYTCEDMLSWQNAVHPSFAGTKFLVDYYELGAIAMPLIVVVGGKDHKIYYSKDGFSAKDTTAIKNAINEALTPASVARNSETNTVSVYPNPSSGTAKLTLSCDKQSTVVASLYNSVGEFVEPIYSGSLPIGKHEFNIVTDKIANGTYYVHVVRDGAKEIVPITVTR